MVKRIAKLSSDDLRQVRIRLRATVPEAAKLLGVDRSTWWRWEEAGSPVPEKYIQGILDLLKPMGVPVGDIVEFKGGMPIAPADPDGQAVSIPLYSSMASAGHGLDVTEEWIGGRVGLDLGYIRNVLQCQPEGLFAIVVDGDSMEPGIRSGEIALVAKNGDGTTIRDGIHLLRLEGALLCKRLGRIPGHRMKVASDNVAYPTFEVDLQDDRLDLSVLGRVVGILRRV